MKKIQFYVLLFFTGVLSAQTTSSDQNYVQSITYRVPLSPSQLSQATADDKYDLIQYFDGLGRIKQSIAVNAGGNRENIIAYGAYDMLGRLTREYLPYASSTNNGLFESNALSFVNSFYNTAKYENTTNPYTEKVFDDSPLNRITEIAPPGANWNLSGGHTMKSEITGNASNEVLEFDVNLTNGDPELILTETYYDPGALYKHVTKNENWKASDGKNNTIEQFYTIEGKLILKRMYNYSKTHDTYYVYDDYGNLTYVLPPLAAEKTKVYQEQEITISSSQLSTYPSSSYITLGIRQVTPGNYEFYSNTYIAPTPLPNIKTGYIADVPFADQDMDFYIAFGFSTYPYHSVSYSIRDKKLYCNAYGDMAAWVYIVNQNDYDLPENLQGYSQAQTAQEVQSMLDKLGYQYRYDDLNRLIEKKIPGKDKEGFVYDKMNRPIMKNDGNLIDNKKYLFTKYDDLGRVVYTGKTDHPFYYPSRGNHQSSIDFSSLPSNESRQGSPSPVGDTQIYYTNSAYPNSNISEILTVNYYDTYVDLPSGLTPPVTNFYGHTVTSDTKQLLTVEKVRILDTSHWITTAIYYDEKARPIYTYSYNSYLQTTDITEYKLDDFTGRILEVREVHKKSGKQDVITVDVYEYDHYGRSLSTKQTINSQAQELISKQHYDELGQLVQKDIGNTETSPLQETKYTYNIRGWLKKINDPQTSLGEELFAMELHYTDFGTQFFNGNISAVHWKTASDNVKRRYSYSYDHLNRLRSANFYVWGQSGRFSLSNVNYDKNGNITALTRKGAIVANPMNNNASDYGTMDNLSYAYDGNQLLNVTDAANTAYGFKDGTNTADDYDYDKNGNATQDLNKGVSNIVYNHLNLPTSITSTSAQTNINYVYDATGEKVKKSVVGSGIPGTTTEYTGNYVYQNGNLEFISTGEGYVNPNGLGQFDYVYQHKDYLENVRVSYTKNTNNSLQTVFTDSFESISNWDNSENGFGSALTSLDARKQVSGSYSGRIDDNYPANGDLYVYCDTWTPINNTTDTFYTISAWVYLENATDNSAELYIATRKAGETGWPSGHYATDRVFQTDQWVYIEESVLIPSDAVELTVRIDNNNDGSVWFDDVTISQGNISPLLIVEESNYYPFGLKHKGYNSFVNPNGNGVAQKFAFNDVEFEEAAGLNLYETFARGYDPSIGRFMGIDPIGEAIEQIDKSPYQFAWNNPIFFNDPDGRCPECKEFFPDPIEGQIYISDAGEVYTYSNGSWSREGGELDEINISAPSTSESTQLTEMRVDDTASSSNNASGLALTGVVTGTLVLEELAVTAGVIEIGVPTLSAIGGAAFTIGLPVVAVAGFGYIIYRILSNPAPPRYKPTSGPISCLITYQPRPTVMTTLPEFPSYPQVSDEDLLMVLSYAAALNSADFAKGGDQNIWPDDYPHPDISKIDWNMGGAEFAYSITGPNPPKGTGPESPWSKIKKWFREKSKVFKKKGKGGKRGKKGRK
jgi:RHS repeat-associated protein